MEFLIDYFKEQKVTVSFGLLIFLFGMIWFGSKEVSRWKKKVEDNEESIGSLNKRMTESEERIAGHDKVDARNNERLSNIEKAISQGFAKTEAKTERSEKRIKEYFKEYIDLKVKK